MLISFTSSSREFPSQMEDRIHTFCERNVLLKGTEIFCYYSGDNLIFHKLEDELNLVYEDTMPVLTLYMKESLCCRLLCDRVVHLHSLYRFFNN